MKTNGNQNDFTDLRVSMRVAHNNHRGAAAFAPGKDISKGQRGPSSAFHHIGDAKLPALHNPMGCAEAQPIKHM